MKECCREWRCKTGAGKGWCGDWGSGKRVNIAVMERSYGVYMCVYVVAVSEVLWLS